MNAKRAPGGGSVTIRVTWMQPQNFDQFDIDHYDITVNLTSGAQHMTTPCGECTSTMITVSEGPNNMRIETTFSITIAAINQCGESGPSGTASYTLSKLCCTTFATVSKYPYEIYLFHKRGLVKQNRHRDKVRTSSAKQMPLMVLPSNLRLRMSKKLMKHDGYQVGTN